MMNKYIRKDVHIPKLKFWGVTKTYFLCPKISAILEFKFFLTKNAILMQQLQKTRASGNLSYKKQTNV